MRNSLKLQDNFYSLLSHNLGEFATFDFVEKASGIDPAERLRHLQASTMKGNGAFSKSGFLLSIFSPIGQES